jgi:hypothetical protein
LEGKIKNELVEVIGRGGPKSPRVRGKIKAESFESLKCPL